MLIRVFSARLKPGMRGEFDRLCRTFALPMMLEQSGCAGARVLPVRDDRPDTFVLVSLWQDLASIQAFVGERWQEAIILPGEADLLKEVAVQHFDESFQSLVAMWRAMADVVKSRELSLAGKPLTDAQWARVQPVLPAPHREGRPRADDRRTLEGILYVLRAGCRWHDLPATYGNAVTCWRRFQQWERDGTWERIWQTLLETLDTQGRQAWALAYLDSRSVPSRAARDFVPTSPRRRSAGQ